MREWEPVAKKLVLGGISSRSRDPSNSHRAILAKMKAQPVFFVLQPVFLLSLWTMILKSTAPICTDHSLGEWGSKSTSGGGGRGGDCTHSWWFLEYDHFTAGEGPGSHNMAGKKYVTSFFLSLEEISSNNAQKKYCQRHRSRRKVLKFRLVENNSNDPTLVWWKHLFGTRGWLASSSSIRLSAWNKMDEL